MTPIETRAFYYSPIGFLKGWKCLIADDFLTKLSRDTEEGSVETHGDPAKIFIRYLEWDSHYFSRPTYRVEFCEWPEHAQNPIDLLTQSIFQLRAVLSKRHNHYSLFAEIPSEDLIALQSMGAGGLRLIESRVTYYHNKLQNFQGIPYPVREAQMEDIVHLRQLAREVRNPYDKFHADSFYSQAIADKYLADYIENAVKGFADVVLVPADDNRLPDAFISASIFSDMTSKLKLRIWRSNIGAARRTRFDWYRRLLLAISCYLQARGADIIFGTTQSPNRTAIRFFEKIGYRYGRATHVFSLHYQ